MDSEIKQYAGDILAHPRFQQLRTFCHHGLDNSVYDHSVAVAEAACQIARLMRLSESETTSVVRAALLHDFFGTVADKAVASKEMTAAVGGYVSHAYHKIFA